MGNKLKPKIRFTGFTGNWEKRKLKDIVEFNPKSELPNEFEYVDLESVKGTKLISHRLETKETAPSRAQRLAKKGDVFYQTVRPYQKNNYLFDLPDENYVFSTGYAQMRPNVSSYFLLSRIQEEKFVSKVLNRSTGTSYPAINSKDLSRIEVGVPPIREEQNYIGDFFKKLDETIAIQEQELDTLKQTKQGFLKKMFPKKGESVPEIRFSGFSGGWKEYKLEEIASYRRGSFPQPYGNKEWYDEENGMPFVQVVDVDKNLKLVENTKQKISKLAQPKSVFVEEGKIIITLQGSIGRVAITQYPAYVDRTLLIFEKYKVEINKYYFAYLIQLLFDREKQRAPGGTIKTITIKALSDFIVSIPCIDEQQKIGNFFKHLDDMIALHEQELETLKQTKKGFLQKMFV